MKYLGELMYFLGIYGHRSNDNRAGYLVTSKEVCVGHVKKYGMTACKPISTPLEQNTKLKANLGNDL